MVEDGILFRGSHGTPEPRHELRERGLFRVRVTESNGNAYVQTLVSPLGLQWLAGRYPATDAR
jgi:phage antirepressor YoqD-like protein